jgi:hypothetical protein
MSRLLEEHIDHAPEQGQGTRQEDKKPKVIGPRRKAIARWCTIITREKCPLQRQALQPQLAGKAGWDPST